MTRSLRPMGSRIRSAVRQLGAISFAIAVVLAVFAGVARAEDELAVAQDYDPWSGFNERMFTFNHYRAVRNGYLQRRRQAIAERRWRVAPVARLFNRTPDAKGPDA
jgi:ABC-type transporter lipoprotein component MlaA